MDTTPISIKDVIAMLKVQDEERRALAERRPRWMEALTDWWLGVYGDDLPTEFYDAVMEADLWDALEGDLADEFEAALKDRWAEWVAARKQNQPLGTRMRARWDSKTRLVWEPA